MESIIGDAQYEHDREIPNVKAYKLFDEGKNPLEVAAELNLPGPFRPTCVLSNTY
jgi:hypothetical protein